MTIVHNLVRDRLGGEIQIESALGNGLRMVIDMPVHAADLPLKDLY
jgi:signal transduction histidine kinase